MVNIITLPAQKQKKLYINLNCSQATLDLDGLMGPGSTKEYINLY